MLLDNSLLRRGGASAVRPARLGRRDCKAQVDRHIRGAEIARSPCDWRGSSLCRASWRRASSLGRFAPEPIEQMEARDIAIRNRLDLRDSPGVARVGAEEVREASLRP